VRTRWCRSPEDEAKAWVRVRDEVGKSRQAYVVCPLVGADAAGDDGAAGDDDDEDEDAAEAAARRPPRSAEEEHRRLTQPGGELEGLRVGLLHGQLPPRRKEEVMAAFRAGELDVLVATTVIEVGVDVTAATVMVVEDADRFGIAQLHQLRGRVGRATDPSWCYLLAAEAEVTSEAERRLTALERTTDGFELAEVDLDLRGEGTVLGTRQQGRNELKLASIRHDRELVVAARRTATEIVDEDPDLRDHPLLADELRLFISDEAAEYLFKS
jgi:ATP-dependent DNA helicase RecG